MSIKQSTINIFKDVLHLIYPRICAGCGTPLVKNEDIICLMCYIKLPRTGFNLDKDNPIEKIFWGRVEIEFASSFLYFRKEGLTQQLIHQLKYKNRQDIGIFLGELFALEIKDLMDEKKIDIITTVPLHPAKLLKRGYNQSDSIAQGFAAKSDVIFIPDLIIRNENTSTQTLKKRYERWENMADKFSLNSKYNIENKKILLIDDVITTGATLEACSNIIVKDSNTKISLLSLCYAVH
ncbi:MAG: ComF family protein [Bacteroidetes bacterium]|nr:ComF family protein [Bacteroidota bacterium]